MITDIRSIRVSLWLNTWSSRGGCESRGEEEVATAVRPSVAEQVDGQLERRRQCSQRRDSERQLRLRRDGRGPSRAKKTLKIALVDSARQDVYPEGSSYKKISTA